jgi:hypothetical protein
MVSVRLRDGVRLVICLVLCGHTLSAQEAVKIPPSPNAASLGKFADVPVGLYTGTPQVDVPLFTLTENDLSLPIGLDYHAGGVRVEENAPWVGLGFALQAGGTITRTVRGSPDEGGFGIFGWLDATYAIPTSTPAILSSRESQYWDYSSRGLVDTQPDIFYFNFGGKTGKFHFDHGGNIHVVPYQKIKISHTNFVAWTIVTEDGITYTFDKRETTKINSYCNGAVRSSVDAYTSAWYLTNISSPKGTAAINLTYEAHGGVDFPYSYITTESQTKYEVTSSGLGASRPDMNCVSLTTIGTPARLDRITTTTMEIRFIKGVERCDLKGDFVLDSIRISRKKSNGSLVVVKKIALGYKYLEGAMLVDINSPCAATPNMVYNTGINYSRRLMLVSVKEVGNDGLEGAVHKFEYNKQNSNGAGMPSRLSFNQDHWGYFNGADNDNTAHTMIPANSVLAGANRESEGSSCKVATMSRITYPTKGFTDFEFQLHDADNTTFSYTSVVQKNIGLGVQPQLQTFGKKTVSSPFQIQAATPPTRLWISYGFPTDCTAKPCYPSVNYNPFCQNAFSFEIWKYQGADSTMVARFSSPDDFKTTTFDIQNGNYKIVHTVLSPTYSTTGFCTPYALNLNWNESAQSTFITNIGGLRISKMTTWSPDVKEVKNYEYKTAAGKSSGTILNFPYYEYDYTEDIVGCRDVNAGCDPLNPCERGCAQASYRIHTSQSTQPLGSTQGAAVGYSLVTVYHGEDPVTGAAGVSGKTVSTYTDPKTFPDFVSVPGASNVASWGTQAQFPFAPIDSRDWLRGLLLNKADYTRVGAAYVKSKEIINTYNYYDALGDANYFELYSWKTSISSTTNDALGTVSTLKTVQFKVRQGYTELASHKEITYDNNGTATPVSVLTNYIYSQSHLQLTEKSTTESSGVIAKTTYKYPGDFTSTVSDPDSASVALAKLVLQNRINQPVEERTLVNNKLVGGTLTKYRELYTGKIFDYEKYVYHTRLPVPTPAPTTITAGNLIYEKFNKVKGYDKVLTFKAYDARGNLLDYQVNNGERRSYLWDYFNSFPVAEIKNAAPMEVAHTSFEYDGVGNWTVASSNRNATGAVTGTQSYDMSSGSISKTGLNNTKTYILSFWAKTAVPTVSVGAPTGGEVVNGWTYYEKIFTGAMGVTISGTGTIDELRLHPKDAFMTTYTYNPGVGITTTSDPNSVTTFYEFDSIGRLRYIRNSLGEIEKRIDYNYQVK